MGRICSFSFSGQARTVVSGLMELANASDRVTLIHEFGLSQLLDFGDAEEEMLLISILKGVTAGTGGTGATEVNWDAGDSAPTAVGTYGRTSSTSGNLIQNVYWNLRVPLQVIYTPETRPVLGPSEVFVVELDTAPADSVTFGGYLVWEELGT